MSKLVILNLGKGSLQDGFPFVTVQLKEEGNTKGRQYMGSLPAAPMVLDLYRRWQLLYDLLYDARCINIGWRQPRLTNEGIRIDEADVTHISDAEFYQVCEQLQNQIDTWLDSDGFRHIDRQLRMRLSPDDEIRVIIQTEDNQLRKLPWHIWRFFRDYHQAEVGLSAIEFEPGSQVKNSAKQVRILAILGDSTGIDVEADRSLLKSLPDAKTVFLVEPKRQELDEQLWDHLGWDILFFAGHSSSTDEETGHIHINSTERLTIPQLKNSLSKAIKRGLALAIFNSCDGLGLAQQLDDLHIPQIIVMRLPVPDRVAQEFLKHFLSHFASGKSFYLAVREARDQLQGLESDFPGASWLPVICQNPAEEPPTWEQLRDKTQGGKLIHPLRLPKFNLKTVFITSVMVTGLVMGVRQLGILQPLELWAFDQLLQRRPDEGPDPRFLLVTVTEKDVQNQNPQERRGASLSDGALTQLLNKLHRYQPQVIGWDIYHDFPVEPKYTDLKNHIKRNDRLIGVCEVGGGNEHPGTRQPPEIPNHRFGFSNFPVDSDDVIRRQLLGMPTNTNSFCQTDTSFSFRVAQTYLAAKGIQYKHTESGDLQISNIVFNKFQSDSGGYYQIPALGYQVMLNYRSSRKVAEQVTLGEILSNSLDHKLPNLINNRIVLIGTTAPSFKDYSATPYSVGQPSQKMAGVIIQAHAVSQILSAVLDGRPLLWWLPNWGVIFWVWAWSLVGGMFALYLRSPRSLILAIGSTLIVLTGFCFILLLMGGWMPLVPSALAVAISGGSIVAYSMSQTRQQKFTKGS